MNIGLKYDGPVNRMSAEQIQIIEEFVRLCRYVVIGTNHEDDGVRLSLLTNLPGQSLNEFYFATHLRSQKVVNMMGDPICELLMTWEHGGELIIRGRGEIITDPDCRRKKWEPDMFPWFPKGPEDENFCVFRIIPETIRCVLMAKSSEDI